MACTAGEELGSQGRRTAHAAPRGRGAATPGDPAAGQLGRPGGTGRAGPAAAPAGLAGPVHPAADAAALASRPGPTPLDLPPSAWPSGSGGRAPRVGAAAARENPTWGIVASMASCAGSATGTGSGPAPCGRSCSAPALPQHRRGRRSPGGNSCGPRPRGCWRWTSSPWTRCSCGGCMCCL